jgi:hypothetical protein
MRAIAREGGRGRRELTSQRHPIRTSTCLPRPFGRRICLDGPKPMVAWFLPRQLSEQPPKRVSALCQPGGADRDPAHAPLVQPAHPEVSRPHARLHRQRLRRGHGRQPPSVPNAAGPAASIIGEPETTLEVGAPIESARSFDHPPASFVLGLGALGIEDHWR